MIKNDPRSKLIKNMIPGFPERGKIKIGIKGEWRKTKTGNVFQPPVKLDHFIITTMERNESGNYQKDAALHSAIGDEPTKIPVKLMYDEPTLNLQTRYACYIGKSLFCSGDGEHAIRNEEKGQKEIECPCERLDRDYDVKKGRCKPAGILSVFVVGAKELGGIWKFRTTSWNTIRSLQSEIWAFYNITGGYLSGIEFHLTMTQKTVEVPDPKNAGKMKQQKINVVSLQYHGDINDLRKETKQLVAGDTGYRKDIKLLEAQVKQAAEEVISIEDELDDEDIVAEFFPEQAETEPPPDDETKEVKEKSTKKSNKKNPPKDEPPPASEEEEAQFEEPQNEEPENEPPPAEEEVTDPIEKAEQSVQKENDTASLFDF
jgi:hypothetical protein